MKKAVYRVLLIVLIGTFAFSIYKIGSYYWEKHKSDQVTQTAEQYVKIPDKKEPEMISVDFEELLKINSDVIAWIYCPGTQISYPVVQGSDNSYYLYHLIDGTWNDNGTIFMDCAGKSDFSDANNVIYGHHMKSGAMFAELTKYKDASYYEKHPIMYLFTPDKTYRLDLLAGVVVNAKDPIYNFTISEEQIGEYMRSSTFTSKAAINMDCSMLTLSTCSYEFDNARYVVLTQMVPIEKPSPKN